MEQSFPIYLFHKLTKSYYQILSPTHCIELKPLGSKYLRMEIKATQYFEKLMIQDLLESGDVDRISKDDFEQVEMRVVEI